MKTYVRRGFPVVLNVLTALSGIALTSVESQAQIVVGTAPVPPASRLGASDQDKVTQGRDLLEDGDPRAVAILRDAAQSSLVILNGATGGNALSAEAGSLPADAVTASLLIRAAEAHAYWGFACDQFGRRDESITALTRALRLSLLSPSFGGDERLISTARNRLNLLLDSGLPLVAPDDVLTGLDTMLRQGAWGLRPVTFNSGPGGSDISGKAMPKREYLITTGKLLPPRASEGIQEAWFKVPSYYRDIELDKLPLSLQLDKMVAGYAREVSGPNRGQWRQVVRVYYASQFLTKDKRDDQPRARRLVEQFLKVHSLYAAQLGASNLYARGDKDEAVTTLWLLEVSALWPSDDDDPRILAQLGPMMPALNVAGSRSAAQPETTALVRPWTPIAGQNEGAPGEILFWKAGMARPESEWLRELFHEYGHVALPPIGGFRPPLEPYGNGVMGETLGMLWAAGAAESLAPQLDATSIAARTEAGTLRATFLAHINNYARPARIAFLNQGPYSFLQNEGSRQGLQYLGGLSVYLERVYGGKLVGRIFMPLARRSSAVRSVTLRRSLLTTSNVLGALPTVWRDPWNRQNSLSIWLPGAMGLDLSAQMLANREAVTLKAKSLVPVWLWVPAGTESLRIDGAGTGSLRAVGLPFQPASNSVRIYFAGRAGWQKFVLNAGSDAQISVAQFERK